MTVGYLGLTRRSPGLRELRFIGLSGLCIMGYGRLEYEGLQMLTLAMPRRPSLDLGRHHFEWLMAKASPEHRSNSENLVPGKHENPYKTNIYYSFAFFVR